MASRPSVPSSSAREIRARLPLPLVLAATLLIPAAWAGDGGGADTAARASLSPDAQEIRVEGSTTTWTYRIEDWRSWATDHLDEHVRTPLRIGPRTLSPEDFERFGVAVASPEGDAVFLSVTSYAMLTTLSLVATVEPPAQEPSGAPAVRLMSRPRMGDLEEPTWSPDGRTVAYALGTARGRGQSLHLDDVAGLRPILALTRQKMHAAWHSNADGLAAGEGADDPDAYEPAFRDLAWEQGGTRLLFTVDPPGAPRSHTAEAPPEERGRRWSVRADGSDLRPE